MSDFSELAFVKIVGVSGNYHYGYIQKVQEKGWILVVCLYEEGNSAIAYEEAFGTMSRDWHTMLTETERKIIPLLAQNLSTKEVAAELSVSPVTIRAHLRTLRIKLQLDNRQQLIALAHGMNKHLERANQ